MKTLKCMLGLAVLTASLLFGTFVYAEEEGKTIWVAVE